MTFRPGDEIVIKVKVEAIAENSSSYVGVTVEGGHSRVWILPEDLKRGRLLPRPIRVGNRVKWGASGGHGTVVYMRGEWAVVDQAILASAPIDRPCAVLLSNLTLDDKE